MNEKLLILIVITGILIIQNLAALIIFSYEAGRDYIINGSTGRRLNKLEKLVDGYKTFKNI